MLKESLKQQAYNTIKEKIICCEYAPNMDLNEAFLLEDTKLSRTPIRDALSRLEQERLITIMPKKGVRVSDVSINDINMIYEMRNLIEPYVIRHYGKNIDRKKLLEIRQQFDASITRERVESAQSIKDLNYLYTLDDDFHQYIIDSSGNLYLEMAMERIYNQNARLRVLTSFNRQRLLASHPEHTKIIDLLLHSSYEDAALAMEKHLENFRNASLSTIIQNGGWSVFNL